ncbi:MAG: hypothetical protein ACE5ID_01035, partial [Acidobacteriota bacterium]
MLIHWLKMKPTPGNRPIPEERPEPRPAPWREENRDPGEVPPRVARLVAKFGDAVCPVLPVFRGEESAWILKDKMIEVCRMLKDQEKMDFLLDLCGIHTPDKPHLFEVVVLLY